MLSRFAYSNHDRNVAAQMMVTLLCGIWVWIYLVLGGTSFGRRLFAHHDDDDDDDTAAQLVLHGLMLPLLIACVVAIIAARRGPSTSKKQNIQAALGGGGRVLPRSCCRTANMLTYHQVGMVGIVLPCCIYCICTFYRHYPAAATTSSSSQFLKYAANSLGMMAAVGLALLLFPVTKPLLCMAGCNPAAAVQLHVLAGRIVTLGIVGHGLLHMVRWGSVSPSSVASVGRMLFPPLACWWWGQQQDNDDDDVMIMWQQEEDEQLDYFCIHNPTDCQSCNALWRNFAGLVGILAVGALAGAALIRRRWYTVFYHVHRIAGPLVCLCTVLHWNKGILYLAVGCGCYLVCSITTVGVPTTTTKRRQSPPLQVTQVERIPCKSSKDCVAITVAATPTTLRSYRPGQYVRLMVPEISTTVTHPFTIMPTSSSSSCTAMRLLIRSVGPFTQELQRRLQQQATTKLCIPDACCFHGCPDRLAQVQQADAVVLVAAGIGITPYLSLLLLLTETTTTTTTPVVLHWICRDEALISYVRREYLDHIAACAAGVQVIVHVTTGDDAEAPAGVETSLEYTNASDAQPLTVRTHPGVSWWPVLTGTLGMAVAGCWYIYRYFLSQKSTGALWPRLLGPIWLLAVVHVVKTWLLVTTTTFGALEDETTDDAISMVMSNGESDCVETGCATSYGATSNTTTAGFVDIRRHDGRPSPDVLLESLLVGDAHQRPALFVCGPASLVRAIRREAATGWHNSNKQQQPLTIYEESFVM